MNISEEEEGCLQTLLIPFHQVTICVKGDKLLPKLKLDQLAYLSSEKIEKIRKDAPYE